jgi:hypothetical protein
MKGEDKRGCDTRLQQNVRPLTAGATLVLLMDGLCTAGGASTSVYCICILLRVEACLVVLLEFGNESRLRCAQAPWVDKCSAATERPSSCAAAYTPIFCATP